MKNLLISILKKVGKAYGAMVGTGIALLLCSPIITFVAFIVCKFCILLWNCYEKWINF